MKLNWIILSLITMCSFSLLVFFFTFLTRKGLPVTLGLFAIFLIATGFYFIQAFTTSQFNYHLNWQTIAVLVVIGALSFIGNWTQFEATKLSPNPGLVISIIAFNAGVITLLSAYFFRDKINALQALGIILGIVAVILIAVGSSNSNSSAQHKTEKVVSKKS